ncbi:MAG: aminotransferase class I/II-fold pyridoxal phosphate-dependent enzyme [Acidobacteriota bacterium]|nr:aminotransferase class I/II-fold pyridoxal phosphate-dependent enzyme [Acidobacteriota bacterium]
MSNHSFNRREMLKIGAMASATAFLNFGSGGGGTANAQNSAVPQPIIRLSGNENPYGPSPKARQAIVEAAASGNRYAGVEAAQLEKMIAERENVAPESIVLGTGSGEVLAMAAVAYGLEKSEMVAADNTFMWLLQYAERIGARVNRVPLDADYAHDLDAMSRRVSPATKLVYVCNPNNPTGTIVSTPKLKQFCEEVSGKTTILIDEAYLEYTDDFPANSMIDFVRKGANVIVLRTFSKIYGLAGMRVGYGIAKPEIAARLRRFRMTWLNPVSLRAAIASLQDADFVKESRRKNTEVQIFTRRELDRMNLKYVPSPANSIWLNVGAGNRDLPQKLAKFKIQIRGGGNLPLDSDWARISIGTMAEMKIFTDALRQTLRS